MKMKKMLSFAMSVFLSLLPLNPNVAFANVGSQGEQIFIGGEEEAFETLGEQEFTMLMPKEEKDSEELSKLSSLEAEDEGESLLSTLGDTKEEEFSKADREDMLSESPTEYPVWIKASIRINSDNKDDVLGDGGSIKYEPASGDQRARLTLNNLRAEDDTSDDYGDIYSFIVANEDIDLILKGNNVINITTAEGADTDDLKEICGICGEKIYCDGEGQGSLSIDINAEVPTKELRSISGIYSYRGSIIGASIDINMHGKALEVRGLTNFSDISNANINIESYVGYNNALGVYGDDGDIILMKIQGAENCNIKSSNINLNINIYSCLYPIGIKQIHLRNKNIQHFIFISNFCIF